MADLIYKILRRAEWEAALGAGQFLGSSDDIRDGFIHFSAAHQLQGTAEKHFAKETDLVLLAAAAGRLGPALRWDVSRGGDRFPHLYGPLPLAAAAWVRPVERDAKGGFLWPEDIA